MKRTIIEQTRAGQVSGFAQYTIEQYQCFAVNIISATVPVKQIWKIWMKRLHKSKNKGRRNHEKRYKTYPARMSNHMLN